MKSTLPDGAAAANDGLGNERPTFARGRSVIWVEGRWVEFGLDEIVRLIEDRLANADGWPAGVGPLTAGCAGEVGGGSTVMVDITGVCAVGEATVGVRGAGDAIWPATGAGAGDGEGNDWAGGRTVVEPVAGKAAERFTPAPFELEGNAGC